MLLRALTGDLRAQVQMKLKLDCRDPFMIRLCKLQNHEMDKCVTANAIAFLVSEELHTAPRVSLYSMLAGDALPQMPVVLNLPPNSREERSALEQPMEEVPIIDPENPINIAIGRLIKSFHAKPVQMSYAHKTRYRYYNTARAEVTQVDCPLL